MSKDVSPAFKKVVEAYIQAVNDYAVKHPTEVLVKNTFPFSPKDVLKGYVGMGILLAGAGLDLKAIKDNIAEEVFQPNEKGTGSNAMAIGSFANRRWQNLVFKQLTSAN
jgi:acyl-homoserine-lactone acylase